jgi:hypothetical protein
MYCNRCGSVEHFGGQCPVTEVPKSQPKKVDGSSEVGERMVAKLPPLVALAENRLSETERKRRWRDNNREKYNNYQREYMRKRRAGS